MAGLDAGNEQQPYQHAAEQQTATPEQMQSACIAFSGVELVGCLADQIKAQRDSKHDAEDLVAQQQSAQWAMRMGFLSVLSLLTTIVGVIFVWQSLGKTNEALGLTRIANADAREIGEAQTRAYLSCVGGTFLLASGHMMIELKIKNAGQSPALRVAADAKVIFARPPGQVGPAVGGQRGSGLLVTKKRGTTSAIQAGDEHGEVTVVWFNSSVGLGDDIFDDLAYHLIRAGTILPFNVDCVITWHDVFKRQWDIRCALFTDTDTWDAKTDVRRGTFRVVNPDYDAA